MTTKNTLFCILALAASLWLPAQASAPGGPTATKIVKLDGVALSSPPSSGRVLAPTFQYDAATHVLHMWVLTAGSPNESLANIKHAVSTDGINFTSTGNMSYAGTPFTGTPWGTQTGEPAMVYPKVALWNGRYKLLLWTYNAPTSPSPWGDYNYNISVNDIGLDLNNLVVEHEGPMGPIAGGIPGQTAGTWGAVNDINYFENNFFIGRSNVSELPLATPLVPPQLAGTGPYRLNGSASQVLDQVHTLPAPFAPALNCFDVGSTRYYVHNDARVLANPDGTLGIVYSIRDCANAARVAPQLFYAESSNNGLAWANPVGLFSGAPVNVEGVPTTGNFALADFFVAEGARYVYISTTDASSNVVVAGTGLFLSIAATGGAVQSAGITTAYAAPLVVTVRDGFNSLVRGASVTFNLPVSGASGTFPGAVTTVTVTSDVNGVATSPVITANGNVGAFQATASAPAAITPATFSLLNTGGAAFTIVITPTTPDWLFLTETGTASSSFVVGPATPPAGTGSLQLDAVSANGGAYFLTQQFAGMRADSIKGLQFSTFVAAGTNAPALNFDVDANLLVPATGYQGRLVFTPGLLPGAVVPGKWQTWDAYTQRGWYATRPPINATCTQATPCTLADIVAAYPNAGVMAQYLQGSLGFKLGNNGTTGTVSVDKFVLVREGPPATLTGWTYDYEPTASAPATVIATAGTPQSTPINTAFGLPLTAQVRDATNQLLSGVTVTFKLPAAGASGTFPGSVTQATAVTTSATGNAVSPIVTANSLAGTYSVAASAGAATPASFALTNAQATTTTTLGSSLNPSTFGASVTFTATVAPSAATGSVSFFDGATLLGAGTLAGGTATFATSTLAAGSHSITAVYGGDANYLGSTSSILTQVVNQATTTTSVVGAPNPSNFGQAVTFTATVAPSTATGTVTFSDGVTILGTGPVVGGVAQFTTVANLTPGTHVITAAYGGDANYSPSSGTVNQVVIQVPASILATGGTPQTTLINTAFGSALMATVRDASNFVVPGVLVTFALPTTGASGTFPGPLFTVTATTDAGGVATSPIVTANGTGGSYNATASVAGVGKPAWFSLQNLGLPPVLQGAEARKVHGSAGTFDLPLIP